MTRTEIINVVEQESKLNVRYAWDKNYDNGTKLVQYSLYYNSRSRKPLGWLQIGYIKSNDEIIGANIVFIKNGERYEFEIEKISDIKLIITKIIK